MDRMDSHAIGNGYDIDESQGCLAALGARKLKAQRTDRSSRRGVGFLLDGAYAGDKMIAYPAKGFYDHPGFSQRSPHRRKRAWRITSQHFRNHPVAVVERRAMTAPDDRYLTAHSTVCKGVRISRIHAGFSMNRSATRSCRLSADWSA